MSLDPVAQARLRTFIKEHSIRYVEQVQKDLHNLVPVLVGKQRLTAASFKVLCDHTLMNIAGNISQMVLRTQMHAGLSIEQAAVQLQEHCDLQKELLAKYAEKNLQNKGRMH